MTPEEKSPALVKSGTFYLKKFVLIIAAATHKASDLYAS
jgi:hypothetical protein